MNRPFELNDLLVRHRYSNRSRHKIYTCHPFEGVLRSRGKALYNIRCPEYYLAE
jgi:hypothetical protein